MYVCNRFETNMTMGNSNSDIHSLLSLFSPVTLQEMESVRLMNRTDTKYVTSVATLFVILDELRADYRVQEVDGERNIPYHTVYLDTPDRAMYLAHQNGRSVREKIRVRTYTLSGLTFLEIKNKNNKGRTDKKRIRVQGMETLPADGAVEFLHRHAWYDLSVLTPLLENRFRRITLVNRGMTERLTIDTGLCFRNLLTSQEALLDNQVVIELKRDGRTCSQVRDVLRKYRVRQSSFSKYCVGSALTAPELKQNRFKQKIKSVTTK